MTNQANTVRELIRSEEAPVYCARVVPEGAKRAKHVELTDDQIIQRAREILQARNATAMRHGAMTNPSLVRELLANHFTGAVSREEFAILFLDSQHRLIHIESVFFGTINAAPVYPREVLRRTLELNAGAVILAHNHPSGETEPSEADKRVTMRIKNALDTVDVTLLDHFVVDPNGVNRATSFAERGLL